MNAMPKMPKMTAATHDCACGCGLPTKREWHSGHDGRANGWAIRVEKGVIDLNGVPANERRGAIIMIGRRRGDSAETIQKAINSMNKVRTPKVKGDKVEGDQVTMDQVERTGTEG